MFVHIFVLVKQINNIMQSIYGVIANGVHTDVSNSLKGAKQYATRNGYDKVSIRYNGGYIAAVLFEKKNNKWVKVLQ